MYLLTTILFEIRSNSWAQPAFAGHHHPEKHGRPLQVIYCQSCGTWNVSIFCLHINSTPKSLLNILHSIFLFIYSITLDYLTPKDISVKVRPWWRSLGQGIFQISFTQLYGRWIMHQLGVTRVQATLDNIENKVINKELVSPEEMAKLKKWYWRMVVWKESTPDV